MRNSLISSCHNPGVACRCAGANDENGIAVSRQPSKPPGNRRSAKCACENTAADEAIRGQRLLLRCGQVQSSCERGVGQQATVSQNAAGHNQACGPFYSYWKREIAFASDITLVLRGKQKVVNKNRRRASLRKSMSRSPHALHGWSHGSVLSRPVALFLRNREKPLLLLEQHQNQAPTMFKSAA